MKNPARNNSFQLKRQNIIIIFLLFSVYIFCNVVNVQRWVHIYPQNEVRTGRNLTKVKLGERILNKTERSETALNILSLGGSTTWGFQLESRKTEAYPFLISPDPDSLVVNIAVRATGADYASQCIQTMVEKGLEDQNLPSNLEFDIITLEFSLNGLDGLQFLVSRLRRRYPHARIVYIHLWSLRMSVKDVVTNTFPRHILHQPGVKRLSAADKMINEALQNPDAEWVWDQPTFDVSSQVLEKARSIMEAIPGENYIWNLPKAKFPKNMFSWFSEKDRHHLGRIGHQKVADAIRDILSDKGDKNSLSKVQSDYGTWGLGDQCISWFEDGISSATHSKELKMFVKPDKWALHVSMKEGTVKTTFENKAKKTMPVSIVHMAWRNPSIYPKAKIEISSLEKLSKKNVENNYYLLDPLHRDSAFHVYHVTQTTQVSHAKPGLNLMSITCIEESERPLRITGIIMCGACDEMGQTGEI